MSSSELHKGAAELMEHQGPRVNWRVFLISSAIILAFSIWAMVMPTGASETMRSVVGQIALVLVAVVMTVAACTSGMDKGIRLISELNLWSAGAMLLYMLVTGRTAFLPNAMVENMGRFIFTLPERTLQTFAYEEGGSDWMAGWTLFFWAFWLAWGPFVGLFLARISRGRTLREFVIAAITAPVLCDFFIITIFGNSALAEVLGATTSSENWPC